MTFHDEPIDIPDPEVVPKAKRRKFSAEYKRRKSAVNVSRLLAWCGSHLNCGEADLSLLFA